MGGAGRAKLEKTLEGGRRKAPWEKRQRQGGQRGGQGDTLVFEGGLLVGTERGAPQVRRPARKGQRRCTAGSRIISTGQAMEALG